MKDKLLRLKKYFSKTNINTIVRDTNNYNKLHNHPLDVDDYVDFTTNKTDEL